MRKIGLIAVALLVLTGIKARAQVTTGLTIDDIKVVDKGMGRYEITATGTMSLAAGDTLDEYKFSFFEPNGKENPPTIQPPFYPPKPGTSSKYSCVCTTKIKGIGSFSVEIAYTNGDKKTIKIPKSRKYSVPPKT